ncbi:hypothetical protein UFOVP1355_15 [uncultured Caudovirales phage]|uniref:Uncharacterized protein n=1 Tax=uncultured Caudovirales phage TaxID=2100421 RepID=A0A6J5S0Y6_9CAUD|nr:hypothetical protein UFOVP1355_15 [uncultured Caudovirales phage]
MKRRPIAKEMIEALMNFGPMTTSELCRHIGVEKLKSGSIVSRLMKKSPKHKKRIHICGWTEDSEGTRRYLRPIYKAGAGLDQPKPLMCLRVKENRARYTQGKKMRVSSIWDLAKTVKERLAA